MGDLVKQTPFSEVTATLEILDALGVRREHLTRLRGASSWFQQQVASALISGSESFFNGIKRTFTVFKTVILGKHKSIDAYENALKKAKFRIDCWAKDILDKMTTMPACVESDPDCTELDIVVVSVTELGFKEGARRDDIYHRALDLGLQLCPAEVGPALRLAYTDQPMDEWFMIAMEPIVDYNRFPLVFRVERNDDGQWLNTSHGYPDIFWRGNVRWAFLQPRKTAPAA